MTSNRFDPYGLNWCRRKRFPTVNFTCLLNDREIGTRREGSNFLRGSLQFYQSIPINRSEHMVERPQFFPLRFTPDGTKLIAIAPNFQEIYVFIYRGVQFGADCPSNQLFIKIFPKRIIIQFWDPTVNPRSPERLQFGILSKDCSFITPDSHFLIVSSSIPVPENRSMFDGIIRNNESLPPDTHLMKTTFYSIDLKKGQVMDKHIFEFDEIHIQSEVYLLEWTLAILSVQHQTVHILGIDKVTGQFIPLKQIGPSMLDDDQLWDTGALANLKCSPVFTAFRQSFLTFLYKEFAKKGQTKQFLYEIGYYKNMKMQKIQFVGPELILLRMDLQPRNNDISISGQHFIFVLLEWRKGEIVGVYDRYSDQLFALYERHNEYFKNGHLTTNNFPKSIEHCGYIKEQYEFLKESSLSSLSPADTRRRFLTALPFPNNQHFSATPYFDPQMFSYDDRLINCLEKGRFPLKEPLILFNRRTKSLHTKFEFYPKTQRVYTSCYARVLFHPIDPFVISISRGTQPENLISFYMPRKCE